MQGVQVMLRYFECKWSGFLSQEMKGRLVWLKSKWILKYFIISKGCTEGCVWNLYCFDNDWASKHRWSISMREVESVMEYNAGIVGIIIIFRDHKTPEVILKCDTAKNRKTCLKMLKEAHEENPSSFADSGVGSGGSDKSINWREAEQAYTMNSDDYLYSYAEHEFPAQRNCKDYREPSSSNEDDQLYSTSLIPRHLLFHGQYENILPKLIEGNADLENKMTNRYPSTFMSVAGCPDSFVSEGQSKIDSDSHFKGTSEGEKKLDQVMIKENTFKSLQMCKPPENKGHLPEHTSLLPYQEYYPQGPSSESSKEDRVPLFSAHGIKYQGADSSNGICSKYDGEITSGQPTDSSNVNFRQASTSYSQQTESAVTTETENTSQSFEPESNIEDGSTIYENITCTFRGKKDQNKVSINENKTKRGSNSSSCGTSSSGSSTDRVTYENTEEGAHYENLILFREEEYYCERKEEVKRNLQNNPPGTFLICNAKSEQVLWLVTDIGIKCFIIHRHGEKLSLYKKCSNAENMFASLNQLLRFYHMNDLPTENFNVKLEQAYKSARKD